MIKVARIFNTYGPRMHPEDGRVVSNFIIQALSGEPITIYGDGLQTRSFCYVDDLIDGFLLLMNSRDDIQGPVNLGNPVEFTILELANIIIDMTGSSSSLDFKPLPSDDPRQRQPDIALAKTELGWQPMVELKEGLEITIEHFDKLMGSSEGQVKYIEAVSRDRRKSTQDRRIANDSTSACGNEDRRLRVFDRRAATDDASLHVVPLLQKEK